MKPSIQKLKNYIHGEAERGYDNRMIIGGLERILEHWVPEARAEGIPEEVIQLVTARIRDYPRLSPISRAECLEGLMRRVLQNDSFTLPRPKSEEGQADERSSRPAEANRPRQPQSRPQQPRPQRPPQPREPDDRDIQSPPPAAQRTRSSPPAASGPASLDAPLTVLQGIGPAYAGALSERLGIHTLRDLLHYYPRRHVDYSALKPINRLWYGERVTVIGTLQEWSSFSVPGRKLSIVEAVIQDGTGALRIRWFNQDWYRRRYKEGTQIVVSGKIDQYLGRLVMNGPEEFDELSEDLLSTNRIIPYYHLTDRITNRWMRERIKSVLDFYTPRLVDPLPAQLRREAGVVDLSTALRQVHFPDSLEQLEAARRRLAFEELFLLQFGAAQQKRTWQERTAQVYQVEDDWLAERVSGLPYALTSAQQHALADIRGDLASGSPMNRLVQGDVGSGKTVVAALGAAIVMQSGKPPQSAQVAVMAPTSILAEQHYKNLLILLAGQPVGSTPAVGDGQDETTLDPERTAEPGQPQQEPLLQPEQIRLMVGATPESEKNAIRQGLQDGSIRLVIGTHALIEDPVIFANLQFVVVDEQHRFGVDQRAALRSKGNNPHLLVMTATPIPRSLALTVYGDLDLTVMDEMPPGRMPVETHVLPPRELERAFALIRRQVQQGRQAFIIYPLVEESEKSEAKAAVDEHVHLQKDIFPDLRLGLLHGRMRPDEKDQVMEAFRGGEYQVLVSTSVVEVGVDVPNATVMLIEGANRFGLAQLHQFRGRVGRGGDQAFCLLVPDSPDAVENERLQVMEETNDGFVLAERDLAQRGPGDFLGTRQSGYGNLRMASLADIHLIESARRHAQVLAGRDPDLQLPEHQALAAALKFAWGGTVGDIS